MELTAIIVEDELKSRDALRHLLGRFCPEVKVLGEVSTVQGALQLIKSHQPQLVFLDIELPQENGFKLIQYIPQPSFDIIFTTAYNQYAVQAFRMAAVDYLLKPIDVEQLQEAVKKVIQKGASDHKAGQLELLAAGQLKEFNKIALPTSEGYSFVELDKILYCEASRSYTLFHLLQKEKILVSKPLKSFEELLSSFSFFRINRSYIINLKYIQKYSRAQQGEVTLSDGKILPVSEHKRAAFLKHILGK